MPIQCISPKKGFTLIEVMVALVVFAIGLLGLTQLQIVSSSLTSDSYYRAVAAIQANDMMDRLRANRIQAELGKTSAYNNDSTGTAHTNCMASSGCTPLELAQNDIYEWEQTIAKYLPSGKGIVCVDSTPTDGDQTNFQCDNAITTKDSPIFAIKIFWYERKSNTNHQYLVSFSL